MPATATAPPAATADTAPPSDLVCGFNHVAVVTRDLDRLTAFYADAFDVAFDELPDPRGRHGFLRLGPDQVPGDLGPVLHAFEMPEAVTGLLPDPDQMFRRGRIDHLALQARDERALAAARDRLVAMGACDGVVRIFGGRFLSILVIDPDGMRIEVGCLRSGQHFAEGDLVEAH